MGIIQNSFIFQGCFSPLPSYSLHVTIARDLVRTPHIQWCILAIYNLVVFRHILASPIVEGYRWIFLCCHNPWGWTFVSQVGKWLRAGGGKGDLPVCWVSQSLSDICPLWRGMGKPLRSLLYLPHARWCFPQQRLFRSHPYLTVDYFSLFSLYLYSIWSIS